VCQPRKRPLSSTSRPGTALSVPSETPLPQIHIFSSVTVAHLSGASEGLAELSRNLLNAGLRTGINIAPLWLPHCHFVIIALYMYHT
jgi:hypothetical protein